MNNLSSKLEFIEKYLTEYYKLKPKIDEERAIRDQKEKNNEYIDIKDDFIYYDKACLVVNDMLENLLEIRKLLEEHKDKLIDAAKKHNAHFFSLDDLSGLSEKEQIHYKELVEVHGVEEKLQRIFNNEEMSKIFFEEILPKNLKQDFNISREEYDKLIEESDKNFNKENFLQELFIKFFEINKETSEVPEKNDSMNKLSFSEQLNSPENGPQNR